MAWRDHQDWDAAHRLVRDLSPLMHHIAVRSLSFPWMAEEAVQIRGAVESVASPFSPSSMIRRTQRIRRSS